MDFFGTGRIADNFPNVTEMVLVCIIMFISMGRSSDARLGTPSYYGCQRKFQIADIFCFIFL